MKPALVTILDDVEAGVTVVIDCSNELIDPDVREVLATFASDAHQRNITVQLFGLELGEVRPAAP